MGLSLFCQVGVGVGDMRVPVWTNVTNTLKFLWNPGCCLLDPFCVLLWPH